MTISLRLSDIDADLLKAYAASNGETVSEYIRRVVFDDIEEHYYELIRSLDENLVFKNIK